MNSPSRQLWLSSANQVSNEVSFAQHMNVFLSCAAFQSVIQGGTVSFFIAFFDFSHQQAVRSQHFWFALCTKPAQRKYFKWVIERNPYCSDHAKLFERPFCHPSHKVVLVLSFMVGLWEQNAVSQFFFPQHSESPNPTPQFRASNITFGGHVECVKHTCAFGGNYPAFPWGCHNPLK